MDADTFGRDLDRITAGVASWQAAERLRLLVWNLAALAGDRGAEHVHVMATALEEQKRWPPVPGLHPLFPLDVAP